MLIYNIVLLSAVQQSDSVTHIYVCVYICVCVCVYIYMCIYIFCSIMVYHKILNTLGDGEGQGSLECCSPWGFKELDMTEQLNNNDIEYSSQE